MATTIHNDAVPLRLTQIPPNGAAILAVVHANVVTNLRNDQAVGLELPSLWRLAAHVVRERSPLLVLESLRAP